MLPGNATAVPARAVALQDNVPIPAQKTVRVAITFPPSSLGDFVLHCHILEHEDGGMMQRMRVAYRPSP